MKKQNRRHIMKKLLFAAAFVAVACGSFAAESAAAPAAPVEPAKAVEKAEGAVRQRPAFDRAKFEERMRQRKAERDAKVLEAIKAAGITDEAKAKELAEQIEKLYARPQRPHRMPGGPRVRKPGAEAPAPQK